MGIAIRCHDDSLCHGEELEDGLWHCSGHATLGGHPQGDRTKEGQGNSTNFQRDCGRLGPLPGVLRFLFYLGMLCI